MMSKSHYWVVCDAVDFIRNYGNEAEKRALQNFELAYGKKTDVQELGPRESAVETLVGFEALHADKYSDLALEFTELKFLGKTNITGLAFHKFTAMNHFVNPYPETLDFWSDVDGYSYKASSRTGFDSIIVDGLSQYLGAKVDIDNSPIFKRIKHLSRQDSHKWDSNFDQVISRTEFAPWTALSLFYYESLIYRHFDPLEVGGPNREIVGIQLLGPVVHAMADACSVQHVRGTLGYGHAVWENYLKSMVSNQTLKIDPQRVRQFLNESPFSPALRSENKEGPKILNVPELVFQLSLRTADRLKASTKQTWDTLWSAGDDFWKQYLRGPSIETDARYLYHLAIAATTHVITEACQDLTNAGIIVFGKGLKNPEMMPEIEIIQRDMAPIPLPNLSAEVQSSSAPGDQLDNPALLLGFDPIGKSGLSRTLKEFNRLFDAVTLERLDTSNATMLLNNIQTDLVDQFSSRSAVDGDKFCPLRASQDIPLDSDLSAHWGIGTFRAPTLSEIKDPELFSKYVAMNDIHSYKAHKLQLTQLLAGLQFLKKRCDETSGVQKKLDDVMERVNRLREFGSYDQAQAFSLVPCREYKRASDRKESANAVLSAVEEKSESLWERFRNFFNIPVTALATAAAVALLLIMIYPRGGIDQMIGLSGETWERPSPKLMAPKMAVPKPAPVEKLKAATIVVFENFKEKPDQQFVDRTYRALEPTILMERKYDFVSPAKIKRAISDGAIKASKLKELREGLSSVIDVSKCLVVTIKPNVSNYDIVAELSDLKSGVSTMKYSQLNVSDGDVAKTLELVSREAFEKD